MDEHKDGMQAGREEGRDPDGRADEIDLSAFLRNAVRGVKRFWWAPLALALLFGTGAWALAYKGYSPLYRVEATFTVTTNPAAGGDGSYSFDYNKATADQLSLTFPYILGSELLTDAIKEDMGAVSINGSVSAVTVSDSNLVTMIAVSPDPEDAKKILDSALRVYPDVARSVIGKMKFNMIDEPAVPQEPHNTPQYLSEFGKGAVVGALLGIAFILVCAVLRRTVHTSGEMQRLVNLPCLAELPRVRPKARKKQPPQSPVWDHGVSPWFSENMETLRLRVENALSETGGKTLLVTSTMPGEGKSTVSLNLAARLAQNGKRVLLVDADLRRQVLREKLQLKRAKYTLEDVFSGACDLYDLIAFDKAAGLYFLGGSRPVKKPSWLLAGPLRAALKRLESQVDAIVLDAPPCGGLEDALLLEECADGVLFVVRQDQAARGAVFDAVSDLEAGEAAVLGYVFNGVEGMLGGYGYGYGKYGRYGYGYGDARRFTQPEEGRDQAAGPPQEGWKQAP